MLSNDIEKTFNIIIQGAIWITLKNVYGLSKYILWYRITINVIFHKDLHATDTSCIVSRKTNEKDANMFGTGFPCLHNICYDQLYSMHYFEHSAAQTCLPREKYLQRQM